jgi:hypothetical protein
MADPIIALCTLKQVKERAGIVDTNNDDVIKDQLIPNALRRLQIKTGREFMPQVTETRTFDVDSYRVQLYDCDLRPATEADPITVVLHPEYEAVALEEGIHYELDLDTRTGTAGAIRLAHTMNLASRRAVTFGRARISITGPWGIWASVENVPVDVNLAAIETVMAALGQPITDLPGVSAGNPRDFMARGGAGWDIPIDAYRKIQPYDRNLGVY